jgi:hypothetical protein
MTEETSSRFNALVLEWLKESSPLAVEVVSVSGYGTDWDGDTEGGFYSSFGVTVGYRDIDGLTCSRSVQGEDMESLWMRVVRAV